jgi:two-component system sensor histidine kinase KdpD
VRPRASEPTRYRPTVAQYLPLKGTHHALGVLAVEPTQRRRLLLPEQRHLIETFAAQIALALERARLQEEAEQSRVTAETEGLRNTLLASISHDLRTPLAVITGASSALSDPSMSFDEAARRSLSAQIEAKSKEMAEIISNVLDLMRLESGQFSLRLDWVTIEDLVNSALQRLSTRLIDIRSKFTCRRICRPCMWMARWCSRYSPICSRTSSSTRLQEPE